MNRFRTWKLFNLLLAMLLPLSSGCRVGLDQWWYLGEEKPHQEQYRENATEIDHPKVAQALPEGIELTAPPRTLATQEREEIWDLGIEEAIHQALANSEILRTSGQFLSPNNNLLSNPLNVASIYDPAIQDSGVLFGGVGTEAALAAFDTTWATTMFWGRNETVQNSPFGGGATGDALLQDTANFNTSLTKQIAYGAQITLSHQVNFLGTNSSSTLFPSVYTGNIQGEYRHQLLSGAGPEFVRVAGPLNSNFASISGVSNGVLIARINADISITNFEANVRNLVKDIEDTYWDLYLVYRNFDTAVTARNTALDTWRVADAKRRLGGVRGFSNSEEAQARDRYFETRAQAETALGNLYATEQRLRSLMGLPINDRKVIRPAASPISAKIEMDWYHCLAEALTERVELRRQKWNIKSLELQLGAAENFARPRFDFVARMRANGFGDDLVSANDRDKFGGDRNSFYEKIAQGDETGWDLGFEFTVPFGLRLAKTQVSNLELRLTKARKVLSAQELEIGHELAVAFQDIERTYATAVSNFSRRDAALERVKMIGQELQVGSGANTLDRYLRAQESLAAAESSYHQSLVDYNKAIVNLYYRKGTLLQQDNIHLMEGKWHPEAYQQAFARAKARAHAIPAPHLQTIPAPFAADGHLNHVGFAGPEAAGMSDQQGESQTGQLIPFPEELELPLPGDDALIPQPATDKQTSKKEVGNEIPLVPGEVSSKASDVNSPTAPMPSQYFEQEQKAAPLKIPSPASPKEVRVDPAFGSFPQGNLATMIPDQKPSRMKTTASQFPVPVLKLNKELQNNSSAKKSEAPQSPGQASLSPMSNWRPSKGATSSTTKGGWHLEENEWSIELKSLQASPVVPVSHTEKAGSATTKLHSKTTGQKKIAHDIGKAIPEYR